MSTKRPIEGNDDGYSRESKRARTQSWYECQDYFRYSMSKYYVPSEVGHATPEDSKNDGFPPALLVGCEYGGTEPSIMFGPVLGADNSAANLHHSRILASTDLDEQCIASGFESGTLSTELNPYPIDTFAGNDPPNQYLFSEFENGPFRTESGLDWNDVSVCQLFIDHNHALILERSV